MYDFRLYSNILVSIVQIPLTNLWFVRTRTMAEVEVRGRNIVIA